MVRESVQIKKPPKVSFGGLFMLLGASHDRDQP
jgi:hypothetical protein